MKRALWFSGGKDSTACLLLHRNELHDIDVIWANAGKYLPEYVAFVRRLSAMCPRFHEVNSDRVAQNEAFGLPADVVPVRSTPMGSMISGPPKVKVQSYLDCCTENIMRPVWEKTVELGCDTVIVGQRADEPMKAQLRKHGDVVGGITFLHPIEGWTRERALEYVRQELGELPEFYALNHTSIDCYDCTAYLLHTEDRVAYLKRKHPERHKELVWRLQVLQSAIDVDAKPLKRILEGSHV